MAQHGLFALWDKMLTGWDFYVKMNQGVLIALPLLMQTRFLKNRDPVYAELFERTVAFLTEFSRQPWNDEGVMGEGPSYGTGTFAEFLDALPVLESCTGNHAATFLPPDPDRLLTYLCHCRSTWRTPGTWPHFLGLSDGGEYGWISSEVLMYFARNRRNPVAEYLLRELPEPPHAKMLNIIYDGEPPEPRPPELPAVHAYRDQPMVFFRTGWEEGDSLVMMNAIAQVTCHGHRDRGTFFFELGGEALVTDPGMISYNDTRARQHLIYLRPATVIVYDEVELEEPGTVRLNFNLLGEITRSEPGFVTTSEHHRLHVASASGPSGSKDGDAVRSPMVTIERSIRDEVRSTLRYRDPDR